MFQPREKAVFCFCVVSSPFCKKRDSCPLITSILLQYLFQRSGRTKAQIIQQKSKLQFLPFLPFLVLYLSRPGPGLVLRLGRSIPKSPSQILLCQNKTLWCNSYNSFPLRFRNMDKQAFRSEIPGDNSYISYIFLLFLLIFFNFFLHGLVTRYTPMEINRKSIVCAGKA